MSPLPLENLLALWQSGQLSLDQLDQQLRTAFAPTVATEGVQLDLDRQRRCGFSEVVFGSGKTPQAIAAVFRTQQSAGQNSFATRVAAEQAKFVLGELPSVTYNPVGRTLTLLNQSPEIRGKVIVASAGTSDAPIAEEAADTSRWMGCETELIQDIGVAGPQRLLANRDRLTTADAIVVVAGMEGALPSALAGWVSVPVIAVPTSIGYGASLGGIAPLLGMLNSCAANVAVVNIDAGFKGGYLAGMIARQATAHRASGPRKEHHD